MIDKKSTICIAGMGLIGGSLALSLKKRELASHIICVDSNSRHSSYALESGLADEVLSINEALEKSDIIFLCYPVDTIEKTLPSILDKISELANKLGTDKYVADMGSTKSSICFSVKNHSFRSHFVALHPIAGTENSGPQSAVNDLFFGKNAIICDSHESSAHALLTIKTILNSLGMKICEMDSFTHDLHVAYVSHLSHITSFSLALSVLDKEESEKSILTLAAGGFDSTVRLSASSSKTWTPILLQNREFICEAIDCYVAKIQKFKEAILENNTHKLACLIDTSNRIKKILDYKK